VEKSAKERQKRIAAIDQDPESKKDWSGGEGKRGPRQTRELQEDLTPEKKKSSRTKKKKKQRLKNRRKNRLFEGTASFNLGRHRIDIVKTSREGRLSNVVGVP